MHEAREGEASVHMREYMRLLAQVCGGGRVRACAREKACGREKEAVCIGEYVCVCVVPGGAGVRRKGSVFNTNGLASGFIAR